MWTTNFIAGLIGLIFILGSPPWCSDAFNIETRHYAVYRNESTSMFGFAVSVYRDRNGRGWAIVGAPEAETPQAGVYRGGAVYKCDIAADDRCTMIHFDTKGHNHVRNPSVPGGLSQIDNKTLQWFGATVSASIKDGGPILACAPRYIWFSVSQPKYDPDDNRWSKESTVGNRREPVGTCWVVTNNFNESQEFSPCRTRYWGYHRQGSCQAGLGASTSKNGERLFIGAPGSWYWQGQIYSISTAMRLKFVATMLFTPEAESSGQVFSQPLNSRARIMFTKEGPATEDDSYMGYSVTTGDFIGNGDSGTAVGVPRGSDLLGKVILFTSNMTNPRNITGEQMGAYFGYAVASGDIDGDGLDDLIVGAPMYTVPENPEMSIETGRVYVIYQGVGPEKFRKVDFRDGETNRGRFGLSLASLGDVDRDGYGDFVVGAPYGGLRGHGAVYVYHGSSTGVSEKYSQAIYAENLDVPVDTFGFSVAGGLDLDGNRYPDLVVGAYESGTAMLFRSKPVIKMDAFVSFDLESKLISLDDKNCTLRDRSRVTCFSMRACFKYNGEGVSSVQYFNIQYVLDVKKTKSPRLFFLSQEGQNTMNNSFMVAKDQEFCRTVQVYVTPNIRDKLTSLDAEMRMSLDKKHYEDNGPRDPRLPLRPILGTTTSRKDSLSIRKNCGPDNVCIPDLQMNVTSNVHKYLLGSGERLELDVLVQNVGEDAFEATYNLMLPAGIDYIKVEKIETMGVPVQCSAPKQSNNNTLRCDIGNPLQKNRLVKFKVLLRPVYSDGMKPIYEFYMEANTTNPENPITTNDNVYSLKLPIWIETDLLVEGESKPRELYYNDTGETNATTEREFGPTVMHNYVIRNQGPAEVIEAEAFLVWPAQTLAGDELLYLLEQPETSGPIACETANANYLSLKLDQRKKVYSHHADPAGVILDESQSGRTINVQRGFDLDKTKVSQKEEFEINSGDSSNIQKTRHSSSSSSSASSMSSGESRRIQLSGTGDKPDVLTATYTQNNSGTGTLNTGELSSGNRGVIFHTESNSYGGTDTLGVDLRPTDADTLGRVPSIDGGRGTYASRSEDYDNRWREESSNSRSGVSSTSSTFDANVRYQEWLRREEERRLEEQARLDRERLEEQQTIQAKESEERYYQAKLEEERRLYREKEVRRLEEEKVRRQQEEERRRLEEETIRRRQEEERRRLEEDEYKAEQEKRYGVSSGGRFISGDREETIRGAEFGLQVHNVTTTQELERIFGGLSKSTGNYELYRRQGKQFVQFMARFRSSADRREYIEFQDGSMFPLQDRYGGQSYIAEGLEPRDSRFLRIEGELTIEPNGKGFIVLKDGRKFPLQGSFTYTEERTYTLNPQGGYQGGSDYESKSYSNSWNTEVSQSEAEQRSYESKYNSSHEERRTENLRVTHRDYERENREAFGDNVSTRQPYEDKRFRRESDMVELKEFKKFERLHRRTRDLENNPPTNGNVFDGKADYESDLRAQGSVSPCDSANCVMLRCVLGPLKKDQEVWIGARYAVDARTLRKAVPLEKVTVSTKLVARVTKQPFIGTPVEQVVKSHEIKTNVEPSITPSAPDVIPLWVVVLSACAGTIILLLLIFLLYKCGFFKRNRPSDSAERQPLNRNGHFHGDDH